MGKMKLSKKRKKEEDILRGHSDWEGKRGTGKNDKL